jgi:Na+/proline symporter
MSTLAALVLISSSSIVKDLYAGFVEKGISDKRLTQMMRFSSAFFILLSVILAYIKPATIVAILGISWGAIGSVFLGPFLWGLLWKKMNKLGAISSSISGLTTCLFLYIIGWSSPEAGTVGMLVSLAVNPAVSLLTIKKVT